MKIKNYLLLFLLLNFQLLWITAQALEVDSTFTATILKLSKSRKAIMLNSGYENGLVVGDNANFMDENQLVATGVVAQVASKRSAWSLYLVQADNKLNTTKSYKIKIIKAETKAPVVSNDEILDAMEKKSAFSKDFDQLYINQTHLFSP